MKKFLILVITISIAITASAQKLNKRAFIAEEYANNSFSYVIQDGISRDIKFSKFKEWLAVTFGDYKKILQFEDDDNCKIIIKGILPIKEIIEIDENYYITKYYPKLHFTLTFDAKDDKYRLKFDNMNIVMNKVNNTPLGDMKKVLNLPVSEYILIPSDTNSFRIELSSVLVSIINSVSSSIRVLDDF